jgi:hypothetical protein
MQPAQEFLETIVREHLLDCVEFVPKLIVTPGLVDEVLAGMTRRNRFLPAFTSRHNVVPARWHISLTEYASFHHQK